MPIENLIFATFSENKTSKFLYLAVFSEQNRAPFGQRNEHAFSIQMKGDCPIPTSA
jgi:hypothetical protein